MQFADFCKCKDAHMPLFVYAFTMYDAFKIQCFLNAVGRSLRSHVF